MMFAVATPVRNGLPHLKRCVGSVRGQQGVRVHHIVQDALSTDGTTEWLAAQQDLDVRTESDRTMYDAILRAWQRADGDVLCWLNADEQYLPGTLRYVAGVFERHPEIDVVWGDTIIADATGRPVAVRREIPLRRAYVANGFLYALSCSLFFRQRLWAEGRLAPDTGYRIAGDADLVLRLLQGECRFRHVRRYLALFGVHGGNLSLAPDTEAETRQLRERYGAFRSATLRRLVLLGRHAEKLLRGCYAWDSVRYDYAVDEVPTYRPVAARRVSPFFTYARFGRSLIRGQRAGREGEP